VEVLLRTPAASAGRAGSAGAGFTRGKVEMPSVTAAGMLSAHTMGVSCVFFHRKNKIERKKDS
jgi:hypothetical protein